MNPFQKIAESFICLYNLFDIGGYQTHVLYIPSIVYAYRDYDPSLNTPEGLAKPGYGQHLLTIPPSIIYITIPI